MGKELKLSNLRFLATVFCVTLYNIVSLAQVQVYPQDYFRSPLDIPLHLSGNFGELRTNHFHAGLDIKTAQEEGKKIYAAADGYVSRIKVSPFGYGYAMYIDHPNGYTTVYGHLKEYSPFIAKYVFREQYKMETFTIDLFPKPEELPVLKGDVIALSGNSGGSGGPHLHFEVRETKTEKLINPLLFGFDIKDKIQPIINAVMIVPMSETSSVGGSGNYKTLDTKVHSGKCALKSIVPMTVHGDIGFAIHTMDMADGNSNRCGVYRIELKVDGLVVYAQQMDKLDFGTTRSMNAHTFYEIFKKNRSQIHRSYRLPNNMLDIYDNLVNDGILTFTDDQLHSIEYSVTDIKGNVSTLAFNVKSISTGAIKPAGLKGKALFDFEKDSYFENDRVKVSVTAFTLYENLDFDVVNGRPIQGSVVPAILLANPYVPIHGHYELSLKADKIAEDKRNKAIVVRWDPEKDKVLSEGGNYHEGWITCETQYFGHFGVMIDSIAPSISSIDFATAMKGRKKFSMKIYDSLSGIDQIIPKIDGKWALMEYDAKNNKLSYYFNEEYLSHGSHTFSLTIIDAVGNSKEYTSKFDW